MIIHKTISNTKKLKTDYYDTEKTMVNCFHNSNRNDDSNSRGIILKIRIMEELKEFYLWLIEYGVIEKPFDEESFDEYLYQDYKNGK